MADQPSRTTILRELESRGRAPSHDEVIERLETRLRHRRLTHAGAAVALLVAAIAAIFIVVTTGEGGDDLDVIGDPPTAVAPPEDEPVPTSSVDPDASSTAALTAVWREYEVAPPAASTNFSGSAATEAHVLVWGGNDDADTGAVLDLATGQWRETPPAPISGRSRPTVTAAGTGFLVAGGSDSTGRLGDAAFLDPVRLEWEQVEDYPSANPGLTVRASAALANGNAVVIVDENASTDIGAIDFVQRTAAVFDPQTRSWSTPVSVPTSETNIVVAEDPNGTLVVASTPSPTVEELPSPQVSGLFRLDPLTGSWDTVQSTPPDSLITDIDVDREGTILVAGGEAVHLVDPAADSIESADGPFEFNACTQKGGFVDGVVVAWTCDLRITHFGEGLGEAVALDAAPTRSTGNSSHLVGNTIVFVGADGDRVAVTTATVQSEQAQAANDQAEPTTDPETGLALGWEPLGTIQTTAVELVAVAADTVIVGSETELVAIDSDGATRAGTPGPLADPQCCGPFLPVIADESLVAISYRTGPTHLLDLEDLTWNELPAPPITGNLLDAAWTGDEVLAVVTVSDALSTQHETHVLALDPDEGTWRELPPPPQPINRGGIATLGDRVVLSGTVQGFGNVVIGDREPHVFELADGEWGAAEPPPIDGQAAVAVPLPQGLLAWNYGLDTAIFDGNEWTLLPDLPGPEAECSPDGNWTIAGVVTNGCGGLAVYGEDDASWSPISVSDIPDRYRHWTVGSNRVVLLDTIDPGGVTVYEYRLDAGPVFCTTIVEIDRIYAEANDELLAAEARQQVRDLVEELASHVPAEYVDDYRLTYWPHTDISGLDTSGVAAQRAHDRMDRLYDEMCAPP